MESGAEKRVFFPPLKNHPLAKGMLFVTFFFLSLLLYLRLRLTYDYEDFNPFFPEREYLDIIVVTLWLTLTHPVIGLYFLVKKNWWAATTFIVSMLVSGWITFYAAVIV